LNTYMIRVVESEYHKYNAQVVADVAYIDPRGDVLTFEDKWGRKVAQFSQWTYWKRIVSES